MTRHLKGNYVLFKLVLDLKLKKNKKVLQLQL